MIRFVTVLSLVVLLHSSVLASPRVDTKEIQNDRYDLKKLAAVAELFGVVKYFYPTEITASKWESILLDLIKKCKQGQSDSVFIKEIHAILKPVAPSIELGNSYLPCSYDSSITQRTYWKHYGSGLDTKGLPLITRLFTSAKSYKETGLISGMTSSYQLTPTIYVRLNHRLDLDEKTKAYKNQKKIKFRKIGTYDYSGIEVKLASIISVWNIMKHFYPYADQLAIDWQKLLRSSMGRAIDTEEDLQIILEELIDHLNDGHAFISKKKGLGIYLTKPERAFKIRCVDDKWVVANSDENSIERGDIILSIDSISMDTLVAGWRKKISSATLESENHEIAYKFFQLAKGSYDKKKISLTLKKPDGKVYESKLNVDAQNHSKQTAKPSSIQEVESGIYYVDLHQLSWKQFKKYLEKLQGAKGIIFDFRQRPSYLFDTRILPHLISNPVSSGLWLNPVFTLPNQRGVQYNTVKGWNVLPQTPYLKASKVFLIGEGTISFGESCVEIIKNYKLGALLGTNTAATNGDMHFVQTFGFMLSYTGVKVLNRDGSTYKGIGISPDINVKPTIQDVLNGKDTLKEEAVKFIKGHE